MTPCGISCGSIRFRNRRIKCRGGKPPRHFFLEEIIWPAIPVLPTSTASSSRISSATPAAIPAVRTSPSAASATAAAAITTVAAIPAAAITTAAATTAAEIPTSAAATVPAPAAPAAASAPAIKLHPAPEGPGIHNEAPLPAGRKRGVRSEVRRRSLIGPTCCRDSPPGRQTFSVPDWQGRGSSR